MSRDKQIEEMAHDMCEYYYEGTCYQDKKPCDCKCDIFTDAEYLYGKGYRKASDLAEEIFAEIERALNLSKCYGNSGIYFEKDIETDIAELKKKYESEGGE